MITNKRVYGKAMSMPAGVGIGLAVSLLTMLIGCAVMALLLDKEIMEQSSIGYGALMILFLSGFLGSAASVILVKRLKLQVSMIHGISYLGLLFLLNGLLFGGAVDGAWATAIVLIGASGCVPLLLTNTGEKKKLKLKKFRTG